jgi:DNA modification methylase
MGRLNNLDEIEYDLFGDLIVKDVLLRDKFIEPPFSVLDTRRRNWQNRKRRWLELGIKSEIGRNNGLTYTGAASQFDHYRVKEGKRENTDQQSTSIFDPALTELVYNWFCPEKGKILDPFAGGSVRGIVAHYLSYYYTGIELRQEQIDSNREQGLDILAVNNQPNWYCGDSDEILDEMRENEFDLIFSCPPYVNLEVYSELPADLSNMQYKDFIVKYQSIIKKSLRLLKRNCFAVFVVGEVRDKDGYYYDFVGDTKRAFIEQGARLYNDCILLNVVGSASMRAGKVFEAGKKLTKIHQNVLIFKKL